MLGSTIRRSISIRCIDKWARFNEDGSERRENVKGDTWMKLKGHIFQKSNFTHSSFVIFNDLLLSTFRDFQRISYGCVMNRHLMRTNCCMPSLSLAGLLDCTVCPGCFSRSFFFVQTDNNFPISKTESRQCSSIQFSEWACETLSEGSLTNIQSTSQNIRPKHVYPLIGVPIRLFSRGEDE